MTSRKVLGKGLGALIPGAAQGAGRDTARPNSVGIEMISPSRLQPRIAFDDELLDELAESIRRQGVIEPLIVRPAPEGSDAQFELVAGERRWRAAQKAGLDRVPVIIREMTDREALETALTENLQREDFNPIEEARAYRMLVDDFGLKQEEVASRIGLDRVTITNALRLLKLDAEIQEDIIWGRLTAGHARALLQVDGLARKQLHKRIVERGESVREAELMARKLSGAAANKGKSKPAAFSPDPQTETALKSLEERLTRSLGTKVLIRVGKRGGCVEIKFADKDQLEGICHRLME